MDPGDSGMDKDGVEEGPDPDGSECDETPAYALLFGDACPYVRYSCWLARRALSPDGVLVLRWRSTGTPCVPSAAAPLKGSRDPAQQEGVSQQR
jgi:hypothetical protein